MDFPSFRQDLAGNTNLQNVMSFRRHKIWQLCEQMGTVRLDPAAFQHTRLVECLKHGPEAKTWLKIIGKELSGSAITCK